MPIGEKRIELEGKDQNVAFEWIYESELKLTQSKRRTIVTTILSKLILKHIISSGKCLIHHILLDSVYDGVWETILSNTPNRQGKEYILCHL